MKDRMGNILEIGDPIVFADGGHLDFVDGYVCMFGKKCIGIDKKLGNYAKWNRAYVYRLPKDVMKAIKE